MNLCVFVGNITRNPEVSFSGDGNLKVARTSMALNRGKNKDGNDLGADFVNLVAFGSKADFMEKFMGKGMKFVVDCHVQTGSYKNREGVTVYTTNFVVDKVEFCEKSSGAAVQQEAPTSSAEGGFMNIPDGIEEELPFN